MHPFDLALTLSTGLPGLGHPEAQTWARSAVKGAAYCLR